MKYLSRIIFRLLARIILSRTRPVVVGVAGSVGKTATKDAIAAALATPARTVRKTEGNFNAEIGVPATVMSAGGPPRSAAGWLGLFLRGQKQAVLGGHYPSVLVLELAADHPGDLQPLLSLVKPAIGVLTSAAPEHLEFFRDESGVVEEESLLVRTLPARGTAVVNIDDPRIAELAPKLTGRVITYGWSATAMVRAESLSVTKDDRVLPDGMVAKISLDGSTIPVALPGVLGKHQVYPLLAAMAVGRILGDEVMSIVQRLSTYVPPAGRMRLFHGRDGSLLIDDTYNASPEAVQAALHTLHELEVPNLRIAVLGQMSELGATAAEWHDRIGREAAKLRLDRLITVGPLAARIGQAAIGAGLPSDRVHNVVNAAAAAALVQPLLAPGVAVLLKGSRYAARLEQAVAILLDNPDHDRQFLVG
ncbi:MAG: UDP-N-acetylmuramoyl-tripeptide--D-alanyl-D-alanine ligase [Patescibacteria group bacterium]